MSLTSIDDLPLRDPEAMRVGDLIDYILAHFHARHRAELPDLVALARKVERVHHDVSEAPLGLGDALERIRDDLEWHMQKEEQVLFPAMRQGVGGAIVHSIGVMRGEHENHARAIAKIRTLTCNFTIPEGACDSWQRLYADAERLCANLCEHMRIEDGILFPRFEIARMSGSTCTHN